VCIQLAVEISTRISMARVSGWSLLRTAALGVVVAIMAYRIRSDKFKRTVLTGEGGLFEDSLDHSGER
jgi:hypothetical protein